MQNNIVAILTVHILLLFIPTAFKQNCLPVNQIISSVHLPDILVTEN